MENAILAVAQGMGSMATANEKVEVTTAADLIEIIPISLNLTMAYLQMLNTDHWNYFVAVESITQSDPSEAGAAAADYAQYQEDSSSMSQATQKQDTFIQSEKSELTNLEQSAPYKMMDAFNQFQQTVCNLLSILSKGG
jgi:hypothetical protein